MAYFSGAPDGTGGHDLYAQRIGQQGKEWVKESWREVDLYVPLLILLVCEMRTRTDENCWAE